MPAEEARAGSELNALPLRPLGTGMGRLLRHMYHILIGMAVNQTIMVELNVVCSSTISMVVQEVHGSIPIAREQFSSVFVFSVIPDRFHVQPALLEHTAPLLRRAAHPVQWELFSPTLALVRV